MDKIVITNDLDAYKCIEQAAVHADTHFTRLNSNLAYHGRRHTLDDVLPTSQWLANQLGLNSHQKAEVGVAAVFHDTGFGYLYDKNEPVGAVNAVLWMMNHSPYYFSEQSMSNVADGINITDISLGKPISPIQKIMRDADLAYVGDIDPERFLKIERSLREEVLYYPETFMHTFATDEGTWNRFSYKFLRDIHTWYTEPAIEILGPRKERNLEAYRTRYNISDADIQ